MGNEYTFRVTDFVFEGRQLTRPSVCLAACPSHKNRDPH